MNTPLLADETILHESRANLQRGWETVGGHLRLTDRRLVFEPHQVNLQRDPQIFDPAAIVSVEKAWTRFLDRFPIAPNSIEIAFRDGRSARFVVAGRRRWIQALGRFTATDHH